MRVAHVITSLNVGGAQVMLSQLLHAWKYEEDQHQVISLTSGGALAQDLQGRGIPVLELGMLPGRPDPSALRSLSAVLKSFAPDVVQTWLYHADLVGGIVAKLSCRVPVVWGVHHDLSRPHNLKPATLNVVRLNALLSILVPARILCCSRTALETHRRLGYHRNKLVFVPNGIDIERFSPLPAARLELRRHLQIPESSPIIGMLARFHPQKDHHNLIRAAGLLHRTAPHVHFVLAGEGVDEDNPNLRQWIAEHRLTDVIHLLGLRRETPRLLAGLDLFTLASSGGEALPLAIGEAMACGVPSVATDVGDATQLIGNTGRCVAARDPDALAAAWRSILDLPASDYNDLARAARKKIEREYNLANTSRAYRELYSTILATGGKA